jgi:hypothetical protein
MGATETAKRESLLGTMVADTFLGTKLSPGCGRILGFNDGRVWVRQRESNPRCSLKVTAGVGPSPWQERRTARTG